MASHVRTASIAAAVVALLALAAAPAAAKVTVLQQGASPTSAYAGCKDTWISDESW